MIAKFCLNETLPQDDNHKWEQDVSLGCEATTWVTTLINTIMEHKITNLWNKIKTTKDTLSKIVLTKELDVEVTKYRKEQEQKFKHEKRI